MLITNEVNVKLCSKCKRELPMTSEYFTKDKQTPSGFACACKECAYGKKMFHIEKPVVEDGYKICIKCQRKLLIDDKYFLKDKTCKGGFRNVCRECATGKFKQDIPRITQLWTENEEKILMENYATHTTEELIENFFPNRTGKSIVGKAYIMGILGKTHDTKIRLHREQGLKITGTLSPYYGKPKSDETKLKLSIANKGKNIGIDNPLYGVKWDKDDPRRMAMSNTKRGVWANENNPRHATPLNGKDNGNWKGGITGLYYELRSETKNWQKETMEFYNYKCVITGKNFDEIHHLYSFRKMVDECFDILNLDKRKTVMDYSDVEFENIRKTMNDLHIKYGRGVCLTKICHKIFHDNFGYRDNTPEQFEEFKVNYNNGLYRDLIEGAG